MGKLEVHVRRLLICGHSSLMALLYDSSLNFPAAHSKQLIPSNAKSKKPSAWAGEFEEDEGPSRTERWVMQERELVITRKSKVCSAVSECFHCLTSSLFTGSSPSHF